MNVNASIVSVGKWLIVAVLLVGMVLAVRTFCVGSYRISTDSMQKTLGVGDHILVNKLPVKTNPARNHVVLFSSSLRQDSISKPLFISRCIGMPGDTIRVSSNGYMVNGKLISHLSGSQAYSLIIPRKNRPYRLTEESLIACREAILQEANGKAVFREGELFVDGRKSDFFVFRKDYYWMLSDNPEEAVDSRHLGVIPADYIVGNAWFCWYSKDKNRRFKLIH